MSEQHDAARHQALERRLRHDAASGRRSPSPELRGRIMATVRHGPARFSDESVIERPVFAARRLLGAAAMVVMVVLIAVVLRPQPGPVPAESPSLAGESARATEEHPQLVQPLLDLASRFTLDEKSPWDAEADRMLTDARHAGRIIMDSLPFRGRIAAPDDSRGF